MTQRPPQYIARVTVIEEDPDQLTESEKRARMIAFLTALGESSRAIVPRIPAQKRLTLVR